MRIVYHIYPQEYGDYNIVVSETPIVRDCEVALLIDKDDKGKPYFDVTLEEGALYVEPSEVQHPALWITDDQNISMVVPLRNVNEAEGVVRNVQRKVAELANLQERWP